jgi:hypothetical protein
VNLAKKFCDGQKTAEKQKAPIGIRLYRDTQYEYRKGAFHTPYRTKNPAKLQKNERYAEVVYDKKEMNGKYQVGSGRVVAVSHDTPFIEGIIPQGHDPVKRENSDGVKKQVEDARGHALTAAQAELFKDFGAVDERRRQT